MDMNELELFSRRLLVALEPVRDLPVNKLMTLLTVAQKQGLTVDDYAKRAGISPTTMSRHLLDLGQVDRNQDAGLGLVEGRVNVTNQRERVYELTAKGRALLTKVTGAIR
jgi:DNA-binding MarR family transcriptional regulator